MQDDHTNIVYSEARLADAANISFRCHVSQQLKQWQPLFG